MEERDLHELTQLIEGHLGRAVDHILLECAVGAGCADVSPTGLARSFCAILEHQFFLGRATALRRTVRFCRAAFVFALAWSFGALVSPGSRRKFTVWLRDKMKGADAVPELPAAGPSEELTLWDFVIGEENMELRPVTAAEFEVDVRLQRQLLLAPTRELCMSELMFNIFRTQRRHMLFFGPHGAGKSLFLDLMDKKYRQDSKVTEPRMAFVPSTDAGQVARWLSVCADQHRAAGPAAGHMVLYIDDLNLPAMSPPEPRVCGLLRYVAEHGGLLNRAQFEEDRRLTQTSLVGACNLGGSCRVDPGMARLLGHMSMVPMVGYRGDSVLQIAAAMGDMDKINPSNSVKTVFAHLPLALTAIHRWVVGHVQSAAYLPNYKVSDTMSI
jgi:hypothetical protein